MSSNINDSATARAHRARVDEQKRREALAEAMIAVKKRALLTQHLISELNALDPNEKMSKARLIIIRLVERASAPNADLLAIKEIFDRVEGKSRQQVDVTHDGDVTVRPAAVSAVDKLLADALDSIARRSDEKTLPN